MNQERKALSYLPLDIICVPQEQHATCMPHVCRRRSSMKLKSFKPSGLTALKVMNNSKTDPLEQNKVTHFWLPKREACLQHVQQPRMWSPHESRLLQDLHQNDEWVLRTDRAESTTWLMRWKDSTELNPDPILKLRVSLKLLVCGAGESKSRKPVGITWEPWPRSFNFPFLPITRFQDFRSPRDPTAVTCTMVNRHSGHSAAGPAQFHSLGRCTRTFRVSSSGVLGAVGDNLMRGWERRANVCCILAVGMEGSEGMCSPKGGLWTECDVIISIHNANFLATALGCSFGEYLSTQLLGSVFRFEVTTWQWSNPDWAPKRRWHSHQWTLHPAASCNHTASAAGCWGGWGKKLANCKITADKRRSHVEKPAVRSRHF